MEPQVTPAYPTFDQGTNVEALSTPTLLCGGPGGPPLEVIGSIYCLCILTRSRRFRLSLTPCRINNHVHIGVDSKHAGHEIGT
jgi:hypothetical protein